MARRNRSDILSTQLNELLRQMMSHSFGHFSPTEAWAPGINIYQLKGRLEVCVDLAGVDKRSVDVQVSMGRLLIRGMRAAPEPPRNDDEQAMRILNMEIDYGPFRREINLPPNVVLDRVESRYVDGLLWITLPVAEPRPAREVRKVSRSAR